MTAFPSLRCWTRTPNKMKRFALPVLLSGLVLITGEAAAAAPSSGPDTEDNVSTQSSGELNASAKAATPASIPALQAYLDAICEQKVAKRCEKINDKLCSMKPVARKGVGNLPEQNESAWRCYGNLSHKEDKRTVVCVDNCGSEFMCAGSVASKSLHMTASELETAIYENAEKFCSPYQKRLNERCNNLRSGWIARKGIYTGTQTVDQWRCYGPHVLDYAHSSQCLDNCGEIVPCRGGRQPGAVSLKEGPDFLTMEDAEQQVSTVEQPCKQDEVCMRTIENPPKCVPPHEAEAAHFEAELEEALYSAAASEQEEQEKQDTEGSVPKETETTGKKGAESADGDSAATSQDLRLDSSFEHAEEEALIRRVPSSRPSLSALLNSYCTEEFQFFCEERQLDDFCMKDGATVVARRDLDKQKGQQEPVWRCVEKQKLDMSRKSVCVNACGQPYVCRGGIDVKETVHAMWPQLAFVVEEKADDGCE